MFAAPLLALALLAQSQAAPSPEPIRLAAPGFSTVNVDERVGQFASEHLAQQLTERGMRVITQSEIATLIGLERQRQLLACDDDSSCLVELGGALGVEGILTGSIGRFGSAFQVNVKVLSARDASPMALFSRRAATEEALLDVLTEGADLLIKQVHEGLTRPLPSPLIAPAAPSRAGWSRPNVLTLAPISLATGFYGLEYERALGPEWSLTVAPQIIHLTQPALPGMAAPTEPLVLAYELIAGARYFPFGQAPGGVFVAAELRVSHGTAISYSLDPVTETFSEAGRLVGVTVAPGALLGYTLELGPLLRVSAGAGIAHGFGGWSPATIPLLRLSAGVGF